MCCPTLNSSSSGNRTPSLIVFAIQVCSQFSFVVMFICTIVMVNWKVVEIESTCLLLAGALGMFCTVSVHNSALWLCSFVLSLW